jgi:hypothetical protein
MFESACARLSISFEVVDFIVGLRIQFLHCAGRREARSNPAPKAPSPLCRRTPKEIA